jgi:hypothetical protein
MAGAQWLGWAPRPIQRPSGTEGLGNLLMALGDVKQNQLFAQDLQNLLSTPAPGAGGGPGVVECCSRLCR